MEVINKYRELINEVESISSGLLTSTAKTEFSSKTEDFTKLVERSKYVKVPLVGVFSAGKSSLLNVFTGKSDVLPVDTMPETAVAYELYYDVNERVELFRGGQKIEEKCISEIKSLNTQPGDIANVYMNSLPLKNLQDKGIILVDMPGIGSGIERHDAAIMNYINFGTSFVLLVAAEQGSLRGSTLAFLEELKKYNLKPAVLISKTDKKPEKDVNDIIDYVSYQMSKLVDGAPYVSKVCSVNNDLQGLTSFLNGLDAESLLKQKVGRTLKSIIDMVISDLKNQKEIKGKTIEEAQETLRKLEKEINGLQVELPSSNITDTPEKSTQDILNNVNLALRQKSSDIANMILRRDNQDDIKSVIISIIRAELIASIKEESEQYSSSLGSAVNDALDDMASITIDESSISEEYGDMIVVASSIAQFFGPWGELVAFFSQFLGPVLDLFFGKSDAEKLMEIKDKLQDTCFNKVVEELRPNVFHMVKENQKKIDDRIKQEVMFAFNKMKDSLTAKMNEKMADKQTVDNEIALLDGAIAQLSAIELGL